MPDAQGTREWPQLLLSCDVSRRSWNQDVQSPLRRKAKGVWVSPAGDRALKTSKWAELALGAGPGRGGARPVCRPLGDHWQHQPGEGRGTGTRGRPGAAVGTLRAERRVTPAF